MVDLMFHAELSEADRLDYNSLYNSLMDFNGLTWVKVDFANVICAWLIICHQACTPKNIIARESSYLMRYRFSELCTSNLS